MSTCMTTHSWSVNCTIIIVIPMVRGSDSSPAPNMLVAVTVTEMLVNCKGLQSEDETSNVCLHTPSSWHAKAGTRLQMLPEIGSL